MDTIDLLLSIVLGLIMFGIGSSLKVEDFKRMFEEKKSFLTGLSFQMFFLPIFTLGIVFFSGLSPELKVGLFIVSICPGGTTSNFISYIVKADIALSISLTCINSILILLTIPLLSGLVFKMFMENGGAIDISIASTFLQVLFILIIPAILGVAFNELMSVFSTKAQKPLKWLNTILLAIVFGVKFFANEDSGGSGITTEDIFLLLPFCLIVHFGAMLVSYFYARFSGIDNLKSTTIGIEVGLQNTTLAVLVTGTLIGNNEMTKPALVFAMFSFFTTLAFALVTMNREVMNKKGFQDLKATS